MSSERTGGDTPTSDEAARRRRETVGGLAAAVTIVTWAAAFPGIRLGLEGFGPIALGLARLLVASLALGAVALVVGIARPPRRLWTRVIVAGLLGQALYQALLMGGEVRVPAGTAAMLVATGPLFSAAAAAAGGESLRGRWPGLLLGFAGAALVGASLGTGGGVAALAVLGAACSLGLYHVIVKPLSEAIGAFAATAWTLWAGTVLMVPALPALVGDAPHAGAGPLAAAAFLGLVPSALGYLTWSVALARAPVVPTTVALYLIPGIAVLFAWLALGERPDPLALVGGLVAVIGVAQVRGLLPSLAARRRRRAAESAEPAA